MAVAGFKRLGFAFAAIVLAFVGVFALITYLISADAVREAVKDEVRALTGLDPVLRGDAAVSLFPRGYISFADVTMANDRGGNGPALTAERLTARLRFLPLLLGRAEIADVTLVAPTITVDVDPAGRTNWSALFEKLAGSQKPGSSAPPPSRKSRSSAEPSSSTTGLTKSAKP